MGQRGKDRIGCIDFDPRQNEGPNKSQTLFSTYFTNLFNHLFSTIKEQSKLNYVSPAKRVQPLYTKQLYIGFQHHYTCQKLQRSTLIGFNSILWPSLYLSKASTLRPQHNAKKFHTPCCALVGSTRKTSELVSAVNRICQPVIALLRAMSHTRVM